MGKGVNRGDTRSIADRILTLLRDVGRRQGRADHEAAESKSDLEKKGSEVLKLYGIES